MRSASSAAVRNVSAPRATSAAGVADRLARLAGQELGELVGVAADGVGHVLRAHRAARSWPGAASGRRRRPPRRSLARARPARPARWSPPARRWPGCGPRAACRPRRTRRRGRSGRSARAPRWSCAPILRPAIWPPDSTGRPYHLATMGALNPVFVCSSSRGHDVLRHRRRLRAATRPPAVPRAAQRRGVRAPARGRRPADLRDVRLRVGLDPRPRPCPARHRPDLGAASSPAPCASPTRSASGAERPVRGRGAGDHARPRLRRGRHPDGHLDVARGRP